MGAGRAGWLKTACVALAALLPAGLAPVPAAVPTSAVAAAPADGLGDDVFSFRVGLGGDGYSLPCPVEDFYAAGWTAAVDGTARFAPGEYAFLVFSRAGTALTLQVANIADVAQPFDGCAVVGFEYGAEADAPPLMLPGGIGPGSGRAEVLAACGEPDTGTETDALRYTLGRHAFVEFGFGADGRVARVAMCNRYAPAAPPGADTLPGVVRDYTPPDGLGTDWRSYTVLYAGDCYRLPAPVAAFMHNGWTLRDAGQVAPGGWVSGVCLQKGAQLLRTTLYNYSDTPQPYTGCFVTMVKSGAGATRLPLELPGGVSLASTQEEVVAALGPPDDTFRYNDTRYYYYLDGEAGRLVLCFRRADMTLFDIELWHLENGGRQG